MAKAIIDGLLATQSLTLDRLVVSVGSEESAAELSNEYGPSMKVFHGDEGNLDVCKKADCVLLCVKPQMAKSVLVENVGVKSALSGKLLISILSGVRLAQLSEWLPETAIIRAMPNTPCRIRCGMTALAALPAHLQTKAKLTSQHRATALKIFQTLGRARYLEEKHMDTATSICGSGPAFACVVLESLADGGVMMGLPRDISLEMAAQSMLGAAQMVLQTKKHPAQIKDEVTTPAGCTIAGLLSMEDGRIRSTLARAVQEAAVVASGLGGDNQHKR